MDQLLLVPEKSLYDQMILAIDQCHLADEVKQMRDKVRAFEIYFHQAQNRTAERKCAEIRIRAERRCGELLIEMREAGELAEQGGDRRSKSSDSILKLDDLGISPYQSSTWQRLAQVTQDDIDEWFRNSDAEKIAVSSARILYDLSPKGKRQPPNKPMPFEQIDEDPYQTLRIYFKTRADRDEFARRLGLRIGAHTTHIWWPPPGMSAFDAQPIEIEPPPAEANP